MLNVLAHVGFDVSETSRDGVVRAGFPLRLTERALAASDQRSFSASARSIRALLQPRSVALVGASRQAGTIGAALLANLRRDGFRGDIYPVNPKAETIDGIKAYPSVTAIGQPVDLGVIAVPAPLVLEAVRDCARAGARGVVVISAGFAEVSDEGRQEQGRLRDLVRGSRHADARPQLHGRAEHGPGGVPQRHLRADAGPARQRGHALSRAARSAWPSWTTPTS